MEASQDAVFNLGSLTWIAIGFAFVIFIPTLFWDVFTIFISMTYWIFVYSRYCMSVFQFDWWRGLQMTSTKSKVLFGWWWLIWTGLTRWTTALPRERGATRLWRTLGHALTILDIRRLPTSDLMMFAMSAKEVGGTQPDQAKKAPTKYSIHRDPQSANKTIPF